MRQAGSQKYIHVFWLSIYIYNYVLLPWNPFRPLIFGNPNKFSEVSPGLHSRKCLREVLMYVLDSVVISPDVLIPPSSAPSPPFSLNPFPSENQRASADHAPTIGPGRAAPRRPRRRRPFSACLNSPNQQPRPLLPVCAPITVVHEAVEVAASGSAGESSWWR